ncbi:hypothetical protein [Micromonospora sp. CPCC 206061]|uniref:hypothetical protein n=1 Tax=Micromonospora sp. CPCC 206061 TaxID=3122410 RepID=UPI002FF21982
MLDGVPSNNRARGCCPPRRTTATVCVGAQVDGQPYGFVHRRMVLTAAHPDVRRLAVLFKGLVYAMLLFILIGAVGIWLRRHRGR